MRSARPLPALVLGLTLLPAAAARSQPEPPPAGPPDRLTLARQGLASPDPLAQEAALRLLWEMGPTGREAAPALINYLTETKDTGLKASAVRVLGRIDPDPHPAAAVLKELLADREPLLRRAAALALRDFLRQARDVLVATRGRTFLRPVEAALSGNGVAPAGMDYAWSRQHALDWAAENGPYRDLLRFYQVAVPLTTTAIRADDPVMRGAGLDGFRSLAEGLSAVLLNPIDDLPSGAVWRENFTDLQVRRAQLTPFEKLLAVHVPALAGPLRDPDPALRLAASDALQAVALTSARFRDLGRRKPPPPGTEGIVRGGDAALWLPDAIGFAAVQEKEPPELPEPRPGPDSPLTAALQQLLLRAEGTLADPDVRVRLAYATAVERLGAEAAPLAGVLARATADPDLFVRWTAARTLGTLAPRAADIAVPALAAMTAEPDLDVRIAALESLRRFGSAAAPAAEAVAAATRRGDEQARRAAVQTLEPIQAPPGMLIPVLLAAAVEPNRPGQNFNQLRREALEVLARVDPAELRQRRAEVIATLQRAVRDADPTVRTRAAELLVELTRGQ